LRTALLRLPRCAADDRGAAADVAAALVGLSLTIAPALTAGDGVAERSLQEERLAWCAASLLDMEPWVFDTLFADEKGLAGTSQATVHA